MILCIIATFVGASWRAAAVIFCSLPEYINQGPADDTGCKRSQWSENGKDWAEQTQSHKNTVDAGLRRRKQK